MAVALFACVADVGLWSYSHAQAIEKAQSEIDGTDGDLSKLEKEVKSLRSEVEELKHTCVQRPGARR
jgi:hypothetical protein